MTRGRLFALTYVATPGLLVLVSLVTDSYVAYIAAITVALPLSLVASIAAFSIAGLTLDFDSKGGLLIAAVFMSGAALVQPLMVLPLLRWWRPASRPQDE